MHTLPYTSMDVNAKLDDVATRPPSSVDASVIGCCSPLSDVPLTEAQAQEMSRIFGALSDPVRLRMLSLIAARDEICSCDLEGPLLKSQPTISHHTRILSEAGLIEGERRGRWIWWHAVPARLEVVAKLLSS